MIVCQMTSDGVNESEALLNLALSNCGRVCVIKNDKLGRDSILDLLTPKGENLIM